MSLSETNGDSQKKIPDCSLDQSEFFKYNCIMPFDITIDGAIKHKNQVADYAQNVLEHFFTARFRRNVDVWIHFRRRLEPGYHGFCYGHKSEVWLDIAKGYSDPDTGTYQSYDSHVVLTTLAHELVHAKQIIKGQLCEQGNTWNFQGNKVDCSMMSYRQLPWEAEAHSMETRLYVKYWLGVHQS